MATKRADGRWQGKFTYEGKTYYVFAQKKGDISAAIEARKAELASRKEEHDNPLLDNYYKFFTDMRRDKVRESTIRSQTVQYNACADVILESGIRFGNLRIRDIRSKDVQQVQKALSESGRSTVTVNNCMDHLSHVFNAAVRDETIGRNPCLAIEHVRRTEPAARDTKHRALTNEETAAFLEAAQDSYYINAFRLMLSTGMRIGEVTALSESDIDKRYIHVYKTITRNEAGGYEIGDFPKTDSGIRNIPLTDNVRRIIEDQKRVLRNTFGIGFDKSRLLFPSAEGKILREYQVNREIKRFTKKLDIDHFTCHAFRATFATRWMEQRPQDFKILSEILGHSDVKITLNLYAHVMEDKKEEAMKSVQIII